MWSGAYIILFQYIDINAYMDFGRELVKCIVVS